jgi:hypothetical protein
MFSPCLSAVKKKHHPVIPARIGTLIAIPAPPNLPFAPTLRDWLTHHIGESDKALAAAAHGIPH